MTRAALPRTEAARASFNRAKFGGNRGDFGISARACSDTFALSILKPLGMTMIANETHLQIGSLLFEGLDQIDLTGPSRCCRASRIRPIASTAKPTSPFATSRGYG